MVFLWTTACVNITAMMGENGSRGTNQRAVESPLLPGWSSRRVFAFNLHGIGSVRIAGELVGAAALDSAHLSCAAGEGPFARTGIQILAFHFAGAGITDKQFVTVSHGGHLA